MFIFQDFLAYRWLVLKKGNTFQQKLSMTCNYILQHIYKGKQDVDESHIS
jgi:hypothetical protein